MIDKIKKTLKDNKWILITFGVSFLVLSFIYILKQIAPFGKNSMLDVDFYHQYGPLLNELKDRVSNGENLLYSFNTGGGVPFYRNFLNYLSSPFNLLLLFFKSKNIVMAFSIIIGFKVILASVSMSYYLKKTFKKDGLLLCVFGLLYAFSGYFCAYYWNIMWLDGMVFLPLIMLGINRLIDEERPIFYIIFLAIMLFANYFIGYMICIFSVLYFLGYFFIRGNYKLKNILKKFLMFFISSVLAAGLIAFLLLPLFYSLSSISATRDTFPSLATNFRITDYLFNHISGVKRTVFASDNLPLPNVSAGLLTIVGILILFTNKKINLKIKIVSASSLLFFFLSFNINVIDFIWHAFHVPNDLPYRYSFIYSFCLVVMGYYGFLKIGNNKEDKLKMLISFMFVIIFVLLAYKTGFQNINDKKVITCLLLLVLYFSYFMLDAFKHKKIFGLFLIFISCFECVFIINSNWEIDHDIKNFMSDKKHYQKLISYAKKGDNDLYRMEKTNYLTLNDGAWYDYYGITTFSSMAYENSAVFQRRFGLPGNNINSYYYNGLQTPVYNTLFNVKYIMSANLDNDYYYLVKTKGNYSLYEYKHPSSFVYMLDKDVLNLKLIDLNPFYNQKSFVKKSSGISNVFEPLEILRVEGAKTSSDKLGSFSYELNKNENGLNVYLSNKPNKNVYLYVSSPKLKNFKVNDSYYSLTSDEYYVLDVGKTKDNEIKVTLEFSDNKPDTATLYAYFINDDNFKKFYKKIDDCKLNITKYNETYIEGNIKNDDDNKIAFTTISYDEGWSVFVDNKKTKIKKGLDSFITFNVPKGSHKIVMKYYPVKMKEGLVISFVSFVLLIVCLFIKEGRNKKNIKKDEFIV